MSLPSHKYLLTYRYSEIIHDLTNEFVNKHIDYKSRTKDQMEQAARSGKQNIVEGVSQGQNTSKKGELKLLGVAKASLEELLADYEDFLRQKSLPIYPKSDSKITSFRQIAYRCWLW
jgi:four helix bundle protein